MARVVDDSDSELSSRALTDDPPTAPFASPHRTHNVRDPRFSGLDDDEDDDGFNSGRRLQASQQEEEADESLGVAAAISAHQRSVFGGSVESSLSSGTSSGGEHPKQMNSDEPLPFLEAALDRSSTLLNVLSPLNFQKDLIMVVSVLPQGLKFTVEESRILQATAFLGVENFSHFESPVLEAEGDGTPQAFQFSVLLNPLCECLNIFGSQEQSTLQLKYQGPGMDLFLVISPGPAVYTNVSLRTIDSEPPTNFQFRNPETPIQNKLIFRSEALKAAFSELDWSTPDVQMVVSPDEPYFRISTVGPAGSCQVDFARDSPSFEEFDSTVTQQITYKLRYLQPAIKALVFAAKTQIRLNSEGMMNMMHLITNEDGVTVFIEFFLVAAEE